MDDKEAKENRRILIDNYKFRSNPTAKFYDDLYNKTNYGKEGAALKNFHFFESWIEYPLADLGCGRGRIVERAIKKGMKAHGWDIISGAFWFNGDDVGKFAPHFNYQTDITKPLDISNYETAICIDVLEHIPESGIQQLLKNLATARKQVISVSDIPDKSTDGLLHVTIMEFPWWKTQIEKYMEIVDELDIEKWHRFYFCRKK